MSRLSVAMPIAGDVEPEALVPVFQDWIREAAVEGLLIDVARYAHVHHGPGVLLIGHEGDYSVDLAGVRPSLRYTLKRGADGSPGELVRLALRRLEQARRELRAHPGIDVDGRTVVVRIYDRLSAPNTPDVVARLLPQVEDAVREAFGGAAVFTEAGSEDPREPITLTLRLESAPVPA